LVNLWPPLQEGQKPPPGNAKTEIWRGRLPMHQLFVRLIVGYTDDDGERQVTSRENDLLLDTLIIDLQAQRINATYRYRFGHSGLMGRLRLLGMHTMMNPVGKPTEPVPNHELGPLG
jgi:hypothetical protein